MIIFIKNVNTKNLSGQYTEEINLGVWRALNNVSSRYIFIQNV